MGDERRINQLTAKAYDNIGSSDYFAVDNASEAESKKLPASSIKTPISNLQGEVTGGSDTYSSTKNYSVGMYVTHTTSGVQKLYRCKTACTAASWTTNASCFEEANLADAVSQLNNALSNVVYKIERRTFTNTTYTALLNSLVPFLAELSELWNVTITMDVNNNVIYYRYAQGYDGYRNFIGVTTAGEQELSIKASSSKAYQRSKNSYGTQNDISSNSISGAVIIHYIG